MDIPDNQTQTLRQSLNAIANDVSQLVIREQQVMNGEFTRMAAILQEAAKNLHECFGGMSKQLAAQSEQLRMNGAVCSQDHIAYEDIETLSSRAVRSLQFEDIIQQMINHSRRRVEEIERLFMVLLTHINEMDGKHGKNSEEVLDTLKDCLEDIAVVKRSLGLENPVKYPSLNQGKIELF